MPDRDAVARRARPADITKGHLVILAVNYRETADVIRSFLEHMPYRATILLDGDGDAATDWTPRVFPSTVLIGRDGKPTATVLGDLDWNERVGPRDGRAASRRAAQGLTTMRAARARR